MISLACFVLLAASRVELVDEVYQIPASEWRYVPLALKQRPALVSARYEVAAGSQKIRLALLRGEDVEKLREGAPHSVMDVTDASAAGKLDYQIPEPGDYALVIDNQARAPASVHIRVSLDFGTRPPMVTQLSPTRQLTVVTISFVVFLGIVTWSTRKLLKVVRRQ
jgi:hypothetical protein